MNDFFSLTTRDGVAHLQLNRPERLNTMAPPFFVALRDAVRGLGDMGEARVLVISSTGKHFCAGMALDVFASGDAWLVTTTARSRLGFQETLRKLIDCFIAIDEAAVAKAQANLRRRILRAFVGRGLIESCDAKKCWPTNTAASRSMRMSALRPATA